MFDSGVLTIFLLAFPQKLLLILGNIKKTETFVWLCSIVCLVFFVSFLSNDEVLQFPKLPQLLHSGNMMTLYDLYFNRYTFNSKMYSFGTVLFREGSSNLTHREHVSGFSVGNAKLSYSWIAGKVMGVMTSHH